jgi:hypothetical protein
VTVDNEGLIIDVDIDGSSYTAQVGKGLEKENALWGSLSVWGSSQQVPQAGDNGGLDPTYDPAAFEKSWACGADLAMPVDYACPSLQDAISVGSARLTVMMFGNVANVLNLDTTCGFSSPSQMSPTLSGSLGERGGSATYTIASPCELRFAMPTVVAKDCTGATVTMQGSVKVTGTRVVRGIVSGDPTTPIVPVSRDLATLQLSMQFTDFSVIDSTGRGIKVASGQLSGTLLPRGAKDTTTGACSVPTPVSTFQGLAWTNGQVSVVVPGASFDLTLTSSMIDAQNGTKDGTSNTLSGTLIANGKSVTLPPELDPGFNQKDFDARYACTPNMVLPQSDADCDMYDVIGPGVARLLIQTAGAAAGRIANDSSCGFSHWWTRLTPTAVTGGDGEEGSMTFHIDDCDVGSSAPTEYGTDCLGGKSSIQGVLKMSATQVVTGKRDDILYLVPSITPDAPDSVTVTFDHADMTNLAAWHTAAGASGPEYKLTLQSGTMTGTAKPVTGQSKSDPGDYDVGTPVATFTNLAFNGGAATLFADGKTFKLNIDSATLNAMNGHFRGQGNYLSGTISIDHHMVMLPQMVLNPSYEQQAFDASYACTADLASVIPP